jgi:hypothetical protein
LAKQGQAQGVRGQAEGPVPTNKIEATKETLFKIHFSSAIQMEVLYTHRN